MQFDLDKRSQLFKNVKSLFTVARGKVVKCQDKEFVISKFLEKDYDFLLFENDVVYLGFPVECLCFKNGYLNEYAPIVQNNIFVWQTGLKTLLNSKKKTLNFFK